MSETTEILGKDKGFAEIDLMTYLKIGLVTGSFIWGYATLSANFSQMKDEIVKISVIQNHQSSQLNQVNDRLLRIEISNEKAEGRARKNGY